ncbi:hypothetical protein F4803DRAFT_560246 [Xylaria telfairii]|nr:hypothetical protein F4803DRAFT_560246 [Xylaria telfairii]
MDPNEPRRCHWEGCYSFDVMSGGEYCLEHKTQSIQGRRPQSDKNQAFSGSSSNSPLGLTKNSFSINPLVSGTASPTNEKKQLPDKHTARKSAKQPPNPGQSYIASATSPLRKPSVDTLPGNPRPAKRPRPSGVPNLAGSYPRSDSSSFSENGIPHLSSRGMFRQSEERTYKLSAVDDFALRPKKKEAANESARSKPYNDQRQLHRGDGNLSNASRPAPTSSKPPQAASLKRNVHSGSFVIDLTREDDPVPPLPQPKLQPSPNNHAPNGITACPQKPQRSPNGNLNVSCEQKDNPASDNKQRCEDPQLSQSGGISQAHQGQGRFVEQVRESRTQKPLQNVVAGASTAQSTSKPQNGIISEAPISKQKPNMPALHNGIRPVHMNSSNTSAHEHNSPPTKDRQLTNGIHQPSLNEKTSGSVNSSPGTSVTEQTMAKKTTKTKAPSKPIPDAPTTTQLQPTKTAPQQQTKIRQGPLSALLGGREWKKMSPEERRLFWVSQHDPEKLDAHIYSENNRPFRPGDPLFGLANNALPSRPQRPATHFDYIDPRTHYSHQRSEEWYLEKQKEISARGNRKIDLGEAVKRAVHRKRGISKPSQKQKQDSLPQRVRENPKWLKALEVLEQIEAQVRKKRETSQTGREKTDKGKAKAITTAELDSDTDMQSS